MWKCQQSILSELPIGISVAASGRCIAATLASSNALLRSLGGKNIMEKDSKKVRAKGGEERELGSYRHCLHHHQQMSVKREE